MLSNIKFESKFTINNIPLQWIPRFELYYPDLPQFPIVYVHTVKNNVRIYGFPASASFEIKDDRTCDVTVLFLSNINLESNPILKEHTNRELEERFGVSDKIGLDDIIKGCRGNKEFENLFTDLWQYVSGLYGEYIPFGKLYEEIYSIIRFVSAWQPKTGRQSEMRMLYNFLSIFGEYVEVPDKWKHLEFFVIPTYDDIRKENLTDFPKFATLFTSITKIWGLYYTNIKNLDGMNIKSMHGAWPISKDAFIEAVTYPLCSKKKISVAERDSLERLVDAFNRHSWRAAFFIWNIMSIFEKDYYSWDKNFFVKFYLNKNGVGVSEKVVACFLQQGFKNDEAIPIDTWVQSFYENVLGIDSMEAFLKSFDSRGKIERIIWLASQANKTNIRAFFYLLWCTRYGDTGNNELRGANPLSCYECKLRASCPNFNKIKKLNVLVTDKNEVSISDPKKGHGKIITSLGVIADADQNKCRYICVTEDRTPKKIFLKKSSDWKLVDEFSGYLITTEKVKDDHCVIQVDKLIDQLPSLF